MGLDTSYVPLNYLETYFVDKDTGLPLSAGIVTFYKDQSRTDKKDIFQISGTPPNYTYSPLPNPCVLNNAGCFQDNSGNDIVPYAYPYDENGAIELYYVTVYSNDGFGNPAVLQWERQGQPNIGVVNQQQEQVKNYISNGQFKAHNNLPNSGLIAADTSIAPGLWQYKRSSNLSTDYITFPRFGSGVANPTSYPRYACRVKCTVPHPGDTFKHLSYIWQDVNKFASEVEQFTLFFSAQSNSGSSLPIDIKIIKNYGTGGSPSTEEITTIESGQLLSTSYANYNFSFLFGINDGKIFGTNDDDYVSIVISFPPTFTFDVSFTNFSLVPGEVVLSSFPTMTDYEFLNGSLFNTNEIRPAYNAMNLYLPLVSTPNGLSYSDADIGKVFHCLYSTPRIGEHECNGTTVDVAGYDTNGIPYARLHNKIYNYSLNLPTYGTGIETYWSRLDPGLPSIRLTANAPGNPTVIADGVIPTGFTFMQVARGNLYYEFINSIDSNGKTYIVSLAGGGSNGPPGNGTSGFTLSYVREGDPSFPGITSIVGVEVASIVSLAGTYFEVSSTTTSFYVWFTVDGSGADPTPGGTGIQIDLLSTYTIDEVQQIIKDAVQGNYIVDITTVSGSSMTPGAYFTYYNILGQQYYVWYKVDGIGADPSIVGAKGILVNISSVDTDLDVAFATMYLINNQTYSFPEARGMFPRFWSHGVDGYDPDKSTRVACMGSLAGDNVGSVQFTQVLSHLHQTRTGGILEIASGSGSFVATNLSLVNTTQNVGNQSNPANIYFMAVIKY